MSELDRLTSTSVSGVPMRPKKRAPAPAPAPAPRNDSSVTAAIAALANVLGHRDNQIAEQLANVLTSRGPGAGPERPHEASEVAFNFIRNHEGRISAGTATCGESKWGLKVTYDSSGKCRFDITKE